MFTLSYNCSCIPLTPPTSPLTFAFVSRVLFQEKFGGLMHMQLLLLLPSLL